MGEADVIDDMIRSVSAGRNRPPSEAELGCVQGLGALLRHDLAGARAALGVLHDRPPYAAIELLMEEVTARLALFTGDERALSHVLAVMRRQDAGRGWSSAHAERIEGEHEIDDARAAARLVKAAHRFSAVGDRRQEAECLVHAAERWPPALDSERLGGLLVPVTRAGLGRLASRMRTVLGDDGHPPVHDESAPALLTSRQLEIAELVAEGLTNAAIADRLFISVRTVTSHLDHIYTRLGIGNRTELAVRLPDLRS
jgi:DNA-binding CsgD family transcriptional regulator